MKQNGKYRNLMVKIGGFFSLLLMTLFIAVTLGFKGTSENLWKQLGIGQQEANKNIRESFVGGFLKYSGVRNIRNISTANKKTITQDLLNYTKHFIITEFKATYEK